MVKSKNITNDVPRVGIGAGKRPAVVSDRRRVCASSSSEENEILDNSCSSRQKSSILKRKMQSSDANQLSGSIKKHRNPTMQETKNVQN